MQNPTHTRRSRRPAQAAGLALLSLLLTACSGSSEKPATEDAASDAAAAADATGATDVAEAGEPADAMAADASGFRGGNERLDTGIDLSKLNLGGDAPTVQPTQTLDPATTANAAPGHISLVEGQNQEHDFGVLRQGDVQQHVFRLTSDGDAPLVITRLKPSCGCTVAEVSMLGAEGERTVYRTGEQIPVGTEFEIVTELNTTGKSGVVSTSVAIYSNDPRAVFNLNLKAEVKPVLSVEPSATLAFGELSTVDSAEGEVTVSSDSLDPFLLSIDDRYLQGQPVVVNLTPIDPDAEGRSTSWTVGVKIGPDFPREGINNFPIVLNTDQELAAPSAPNADGTPVYHQARVYAQATVLAMVAANPPFVSFGMMRPEEAIEKTIRITTMDPEFTMPEDPVVRLEGYRGIEFPHADAFELSVLPVPGENALDLDLKLKGMPAGFSGSFGGVVVVEVAHPSKPDVQVRFSGVCRAGIAAQPQPQAETKEEDGHDDHDGHDH